MLDQWASRLGATSIAADLSDPGQVEELLARVEGIDVLVANAGIPASGLVSEYSIVEIDRALAVNLRAPIVMAKVLSARMVSKGAGHIVFMSSLSGKSASAHMALYNATKFGLRGFSLALREDLRPHGVGVSAVFPGPIRDAGMIADTDVRIPRLGTRTASAVADATLQAIDDDRAEVDVAPWPLRAATLLGSLAPDFTARVQRRTGGDKTMAALGRAQQNKR